MTHTINNKIPFRILGERNYYVLEIENYYKATLYYDIIQYLSRIVDVFSSSTVLTSKV